MKGELILGNTHWKGVGTVTDKLCQFNLSLLPASPAGTGLLLQPGKQSVR